MINNKVLSIILGGGQGSRLYPLTADRSKPAVPIAGKYRLVDILISNCINSEIKRMYVLTQFNSASLNKHIKNTYHFSFFSNALESMAVKQAKLVERAKRAKDDAAAVMRLNQKKFEKREAVYKKRIEELESQTATGTPDDSEKVAEQLKRDHAAALLLEK